MKDVISRADALALLTHDDGMPYLNSVARLKDNPVARAVKLADLRHNSDESRLENANPETLAYFREKYKKAFEILE